MNHRCAAINPETNEIRHGMLTTDHAASSQGQPVVVIDGKLMDAGQDGFTGLGVDLPPVRHEDPEEGSAYGHHTDLRWLLERLFKLHNAPDNSRRWDYYNYG